MESKSSDSVVFTIGDDTYKGPGPNDNIKIDIDDSNKGGEHEHDADDNNNNNDKVIAITAAAAEADAAAPPVPLPEGGYKKKRGGGAMQIVQVAFYMLRRRHRSAGPSKSKSMSCLEDAAVVSPNSKSTWKRLVGSIRPLHLQGGSSSPNPTPPSSEGYEDVLPPPMSEDLSSEDGNGGMSSRYASAVNLQDLDRTNDQDDKPNINVGGVGDDLIDSKAEEFIAQFYQQMRLQRSDSMDARNSININERTTSRSIG